MGEDRETSHVIAMLQRDMLRESAVGALYGVVALYASEVEGRGEGMASRLAIRSVQVLALEQEGFTQPEIADRMGISERTVNADRARLRDAVGWNGGRLSRDGDPWPLPEDEEVLRELAAARSRLVRELGDEVVYVGPDVLRDRPDLSDMRL